MSGTRGETWLIEPRDPLVIRDGRGFVEVGAGPPLPLPLPTTVAGLVRACFAADQAHVGPDEARALLEKVRVVRGPWLVEEERSDHGARYVPWLPAAADARIGGARRPFICPISVIAPGRDEGVLWPNGSPSGLGLLHLPERDEHGLKTRAAADVKWLRFWPLDLAVRWAVGSGGPLDIEDDRRRFKQRVRAQRQPVREEVRIHVVLDDAAGSAEAGLLYSTPGLRFGEGFALALELETELPARRDSELVVLGGEGRVSRRRAVPGAAFPPFAAHREAYKEGVGRKPAGIRLQLLTPAWLHDGADPGQPAWLPSWAAGGADPLEDLGLRLELAAACIPGFTPISGWNLQARENRGPRAVRRLVPAGSVYYARVWAVRGKQATPAEPDDLLKACERLWARPIEPSRGRAGTRDDFLAPAAHDGYGLTLPGFWWSA